MGLSWPLLVGAAAFALSLSSALLSDPDVYWHIATAKWMLDHLAIPTVDLFSSHMKGAPWLAHEWLGEVILGAAYQLGGWSGLVIVPAATYGAALAILCRYLLRHLEPIYALVAAGLAGLVVAPHLLARPHALILPLLVGWTVMLMRVRERREAPRWYWSALMLAWANAHASYMLGLGLAAVLAIEAAWESRGAGLQKTLRDWGGFLICSLGAALATPKSLAVIMLPISAASVPQDAFLNLIAEFKSPDFHHLQPLELLLMLGGFLFLSRGIRLPVVRLLLVLGLLHLALKHVRHADFFGLLAPLLVAESIGRQWRSGQAVGFAAKLDKFFVALAAPAGFRAKAVTGCLLAAFAWASSRYGEMKPPLRFAPVAAVASALAVKPPGNVLNDYNFGGYLIFAGVPPFVDGRGDPYGDQFLAEYARAITLESPEYLMTLLARHDIGWTLLAPGTPALALLDRLPGWRRSYADKVAVVHVKTSRR